jgi:ATP-binding cassette subfamily B protein
MLSLTLQLLRWVPEARREFFLAVLYKVLEGIFSATPYVFAFLAINDLVSQSLTLNKVVAYVAAMAVCYVLQGGFNYLFSRTIWPMTNNMVNRLRLMAGEHLRKLPMSYFSRNTTGHLHTLVADELKCIQVFFYQAIPDVILTLVYVGIIPLALLFVDWRLTLVTLAVIPLAIPCYYWSRRVLSTDLQKRSESVSAVNNEIVQYVQGIEVSKAFGISQKRFQAFEDTLREFRDVNMRATFRGGVPIKLTWIFLDMGICLIPSAAVYFMYGGTLGLTTFLIFMIMGLRIYEPFKGFFMATAFWKLAEPAADKLAALLETAPLPAPQSGGEPQSYDIRFNNVRFGYGDQQVLDGVSFHVPANTITALVGPSGSGKTTIFRLLARFWDVDDGSISIGGHDIREMNQEDLLSNISMVLQDVYLFNDTIYQNIAYGSHSPTKERVIAAAKAAHCHDFIQQLPDGYDTMVGEGGATLSGGEKQRISIARAILKDAPIILLDEATASVDPENEALIQRAVNTLVQTKTLIIIAHRLSSITSAHQIVVLNKKGTIEESGNHDELLEKKGLYAALWESRSKGSQWSVR